MVHLGPRLSLLLLTGLSIALPAIDAGGAPYTICTKFASVCKRQSDRCDRGSVHPASHRCGVALENTRASPSCSSPEECFRRAGFPVEQAGFRRFRDAWDCSDCCKAGHSEDECRFDVPASRCSVPDMMSSCPSVVNACQNDGLCLQALTSYRTNGCARVSTCWDDLGLDEGADGFKVWKELKTCHQCCADFVHGSNDRLERFDDRRGAVHFCNVPLAFTHPLDNAVIALPAGRDIRVPIEWKFAGADSGACEGAKCVYNLLLFKLAGSDGLEKPIGAVVLDAAGPEDPSPVHLGAVVGQRSFIWTVNAAQFAPGDYVLQVQPVFFGSSLVADRHISLASTNGGKELEPPAGSSTAAATLILTVVATVMFVLVVVLCAARKRGRRGGRWTFSSTGSDLVGEEDLLVSSTAASASTSLTSPIPGTLSSPINSSRGSRRHTARSGVVSSHSASIGIRAGKRPLLPNDSLRAKSHETGGGGYNYGSFYHSDDSHGPVPPAAGAESGAEGGGMTTDSETGFYLGEGHEGARMDLYEAKDPCRAGRRRRKGSRSSLSTTSDSDTTTSSSSSSSSRIFPCPYCSKTFKQKGNLTVHVKIHLGIREFNCPTCGRLFAKKQNRDNHARTHTGERPFTCSMCPMSFARRNTLTRHFKTHTGARPFHCQVCGRRFVSEDRLESHKKSHVDEPVATSGNFTCRFCPLRFACTRELERHTEAQHAETTQDASEGVVVASAVVAAGNDDAMDAGMYASDAHIVAVPVPAAAAAAAPLASSDVVVASQLSPIPIPGTASRPLGVSALGPQSLDTSFHPANPASSFSSTPPPLSPIPLASAAAGQHSPASATYASNASSSSTTRRRARGSKLRSNPPASPARSTASTMTTTSHHSPSASPRRRRQATASSSSSSSSAQQYAPMQASSPGPLSPIPPPAAADSSRPASPAALMSVSLALGRGAFAPAMASPRTVSMAADMLRAAEGAPLFCGASSDAAAASDSEGAAPESPVFLQRAFSSAIAHIRPGTPPRWGLGAPADRAGTDAAAGHCHDVGGLSGVSSSLSPLRAFSKHAMSMPEEMEGVPHLEPALHYVDAMMPSTPGHSSFHFPKLETGNCASLGPLQATAAAALRPFGQQFAPRRSREELVCPHCRLLFDSESFSFHQGCCPLRPVQQEPSRPAGADHHRSRVHARSRHSGGFAPSSSSQYSGFGAAGVATALPTVPEPHTLVAGYDVADVFLA